MLVYLCKCAGMLTQILRSRHGERQSGEAGTMSPNVENEITPSCIDREIVAAYD